MAWVWQRYNVYIRGTIFSFSNHSWVVKLQDAQDHREADLTLGLKPQVKVAQVLAGRWKADENLTRTHTGSWSFLLLSVQLVSNTVHPIPTTVLLKRIPDKALRLNWLKFRLINCSIAKLCPSLCNPVDCSMLGSCVLHYLPDLLKFMYTELVMLYNHLIFCQSLLLLLSILLSIRVFSNALDKFSSLYFVVIYFLFCRFWVQKPWAIFNCRMS